MPASFEEIFSSRIFKFTVGQKADGEATTFSVHQEAIASLSEPLHTLINSGLSESATGHTVWDDVSKGTFMRFAQFAYTGDYSVPVLETRVEERPEVEPVDEDPIVLEKELLALGSREEQVPGIFASGDSGRKGHYRHKTKPKRSRGLEVVQGFPMTPLPLLSSRNKYEDTCEPASTFEPGKRYSNAFISHASLWLLGDYRHIKSLKALALHKLHKTLLAFKPSNKNVDEVVDLVRCAYSEEGAGQGAGISGLRRLVCQYLAMHRAILCEFAQFSDLLAEGGQFVKDLFKYSSI